MMTQLLMYLLCGLANAVLAGSSNVSAAYRARQVENMDIFGNREIFVTTVRNEVGKAEYSQSLPYMPEEWMDDILELEDCEKYYPFYEAKITVGSYQGKELPTRCVLQPYVLEKYYEHSVQIGMGKVDGVYLSASLGKNLGVETITDDKLSFYMMLPDGSEVSQMVVVDGILEENVPNHYSSHNDIIYMPINMMPSLDKVQVMLVYSTRYDKIDGLKQRIQELYPNLRVFSVIGHTQQIDNALTNMDHFSRLLAIVLILICALMLFLICSRYIRQRKKEMCLLRVNVLSKSEVFDLIFVELVMQALTITFVACLFLSILYLYMIWGQKLAIAIHVFLDIGKSLVYAFMLLSIPSIVSLLSYQHDDLAVALRVD